ncbi:hypothetical protein KAU92_01125 [Candidatus Bathyarchaeota archaeon]|nr:hypothetical protein [Candidatus Bathyarchaeota archaeon]
MKDSFNSLVEFLCESKKTVLLIIVVATITLIVSTMIGILLDRANHLYIPSFGTIRTYGVEAYGESIIPKDGEQIIDWGTIYPGTSISRSFYVHSRSSTDAIVIFETANWTFFDSGDNDVTGFFTNNMSLKCDYNRTIIPRDERIYVTLTLTAGSSPSFINDIIVKDVQKFSFDIVIYASKE